MDLEWVEKFTRAKKSSHIPIILTKDEVKIILGKLDGTNRLIAELLYGAGLRLQEALRLRVKDAYFGFNQILVGDGKGGKDRFSVLPKARIEPPKEQIKIVYA